MASLVKHTTLKGLLFLLLALVAVACDDNDPEPKPTSTEELIAQTWRIDKVTYNGQEMSSGSYSIKFNDGKTFVFNTPGVPGLPQNGNWEYIPSSSGIIRLNGGTDLVIIGQITKSSFVFEHTYTNHKMGPVKVIFSLVP